MRQYVPWLATKAGTLARAFGRLISDAKRRSARTVSLIHRIFTGALKRFLVLHQIGKPHPAVLAGPMKCQHPMFEQLDEMGRDTLSRSAASSVVSFALRTDHVAHGSWRFAEPFDITQCRSKERESKTRLSEEDGPITDVPMLLARELYFAWDRDQALSVLAEAHAAVSRWRESP